MLKSEVQHQFWITKKAVQRKLGSKEDEYIVSSDASLDSKIFLFKSVSETCSALNKILDQYQERLCILSQEECTFGRFLKEIGKRSKTTGSSIMNSGKAIYYCGQQRLAVRVPLLRLHQEVDVFRCRAISDTLVTINCMEKERTEYRAALCWMKSVSTQLDPDNGKGLDNFRRAQTHVRTGKDNFDKLSMDCIQKIDLLAAARCNMFSHGLVAYMSVFLQFSKKSASTFKAVAASLASNPRYDFCVLKDLSQNNTQSENQTEDMDQSLFFSDEFQDKVQKSNSIDEIVEENGIENVLIELTQCIEENDSTSNLENNWFNDSDINKYISALENLEPKKLILDESKGKTKMTSETKANHTESKQNDSVSKWFNLFADLDPLENLQTFDLKLHTKANTQQT